MLLFVLPGQQACKTVGMVQKKDWQRICFQRNDGITELRINGYESVREILKKLYPYVKFKRKQIGYVLKALDLLRQKSFRELTKAERLKVAHAIFKSRQETYQSGSKKMEKLESDLKKITET